MVRSIIRTAVLAGVATATAWSVKRWLEQRSHKASRAGTREAINDWENEGGALVALPPRRAPRVEDETPD
jgi:hypothetical protein